MAAPRFWFTPADKPAIAARLLAPLGWIYGAATAGRIQSGKPWKDRKSTRLNPVTL